MLIRSDHDGEVSSIRQTDVALSELIGHCSASVVDEPHYHWQNYHSRRTIGVELDGGMVAPPPPPTHTQKSGNRVFSGNYHAKLRHFVKFSYIFHAKMSCPSKLTADATPVTTTLWVVDKNVSHRISFIVSWFRQILTDSQTSMAHSAVYISNAAIIEVYTHTHTHTNVSLRTVL